MQSNVRQCWAKLDLKQGALKVCFGRATVPMLLSLSNPDVASTGNPFSHLNLCKIRLGLVGLTKEARPRHRVSRHTGVLRLLCASVRVKHAPVTHTLLHSRNCKQMPAT